MGTTKPQLFSGTSGGAQANHLLAAVCAQHGPPSALGTQGPAPSAQQRLQPQAAICQQCCRSPAAWFWVVLLLSCPGAISRLGPSSVPKGVWIPATHYCYVARGVRNCLRCKSKVSQTQNRYMPLM